VNATKTGYERQIRANPDLPLNHGNRQVAENCTITVPVLDRRSNPRELVQHLSRRSSAQSNPCRITLSVQKEYNPMPDKTGGTQETAKYLPNDTPNAVLLARYKVSLSHRKCPRPARAWCYVPHPKMEQNIRASPIPKRARHQHA